VGNNFWLHDYSLVQGGNHTTIFLENCLMKREIPWRPRSVTISILALPKNTIHGIKKRIRISNEKGDEHFQNFLQ
jgi:hypothetical protein